MPDESSNTDDFSSVGDSRGNEGPVGTDPFQQMGDSEESPFGASGQSEFEASVSSIKTQATVAFEVGKVWVKEHQKATMLGAFATGVVLGALIRD